MGIQGLLPVLRPYMRAVHVSKFSGKRIAADGYSWLHKGVYSCSGLVATGQAPWRAKGRRAPYVEYCLNRVRRWRLLLLHIFLLPAVCSAAGKCQHFLLPLQAGARVSFCPNCAYSIPCR
jgi:exonuclease-1